LGEKLASSARTFVVVIAPAADRKPSVKSSDEAPEMNATVPPARAGAGE
jgi:hypothetical protein